MTVKEGRIHQAEQRSRGYWLLSRLWLEVPTADRLAELSEVLADASAGGSLREAAVLSREVTKTLAQPDEAAAAFTRHLVIGDRESGEHLPFEAHVCEGRLPGERSEQVRAMIYQAGFGELLAEASSPDHLGIELRFMALLCYGEHQARVAERTTKVVELLRLQGEFLNYHLAAWAPGYCLALGERSDNGYLSAVARLTASVIVDDVAVVKHLCRRTIVTCSALAAAA
jgi:TorA maturation chaperone TorD